MMKTQLFAFLSFAVFSAMAGSVKWEPVNIYPNSGDGESYGTTTNSLLGVATTVDHYYVLENLVETKRRIDILWTDYTNRLERITQMREKRRVAEEKKAARSRAFEIRKKYRAKDRSK